MGANWIVYFVRALDNQKQMRSCYLEAYELPVYRGGRLKNYFQKRRTEALGHVMSKINRSDIYDKNLNFLIGSGASVGLLPTLSVSVQNSDTEKHHTLETLATHFEDNEEIMALLFSLYVRDVILPAASFNAKTLSKLRPDGRKVVENYERFLKTLLMLLEKKSKLNRANIFTTNYDGLIAHAAERLIQSENWDFTLNDGGVGFIKRVLQTKNFSRYVKDQGVFDRHEKSVPQINLIQPHGSVYWYKRSEQIEISYNRTSAKRRIEEVPLVLDDDFEKVVDDEDCTEEDFEGISFSIDEDEIAKFWESYKSLPIVNPTKWKFHETVFEEHYYQSLRLLSYELERPNSVFIVFGFSFADEHILNLVKRSLSNPTLKIFICCYSERTRADLEAKFEGARNVEFICLEEPLDFTAFNEHVFSVKPSPAEGTVDD